MKTPGWYASYARMIPAMTSEQKLIHLEIADCILNLESRLAQAEREMDALMYYAKGCCTTCAFRDDCAKHDLNDSSPYGERWYYGDCDDWEWRGVCEENTK